MAEEQHIYEIKFVTTTEVADTTGLDQLNQKISDSGDRVLSAREKYMIFRSTLMEMGMTTWFIGIGVNQLTNAMIMLTQKSEMASGGMKLLQQSIGSVTFGFYAMTNLTKMVSQHLGLFGYGTAVTEKAVKAAGMAISTFSVGMGALIAVLVGVIPVLMRWNQEMEESYAKSLKTAAGVDEMIDAYFKADKILDMVSALQELKVAFGEDVAMAVRDASGSMDAYSRIIDEIIEKEVKKWKSTTAGKEALAEVREEMIRINPELVTYINETEGVITTIFDENVELQRLIESWKEYYGITKRETTGQKMTPEMTAWIRGRALEEEYQKEYDTIQKQQEQAYQNYLQAYENYQDKLVQLVGDEEEIWKHSLDKLVKNWQEAGLSRQLIEEYVKVAIIKHEEELTDAMIEEVFEREQAEWDAIEERKNREEQEYQNRLNIIDNFQSKYVSTLEGEVGAVINALSKETAEYIKAGGSIENARKVVEAEITKIVEQQIEERIRALEAERDKQLNILEQEKEARYNLYNRIVELNLDETQQNIMQLIKQKLEYEKFVKDKVLLETWFNKEIKAIHEDLWRDYNEKVAQATEQAKEQRLQSEESITTEINRLKLSQLEYDKWILEQQLQEYANSGVEQEKLQEYASLKINEIKQREIDNWIAQEERKKQAQESAFNRYMEFILKAEGKEKELTLLREQRAIKDIISDLYKAYGEEGLKYIEDIMAKTPEYLTRLFPDLELTQEEINTFVEQLRVFQEQLLIPITPPEIEIEIKIPETLDILKEAIEAIEKPPSLEEIKTWATEIANTLLAVDMIIGGWYDSAKAQIDKIYTELMEEEKRKAEELKNEIINKIISYDWKNLGITTGSQFGEGFFEGFIKHIPEMIEEIRKYFEFHSPPEKGALRNTEDWGAGFILEFIRGMLSASGSLNTATLKLFIELPFSQYASVVLKNMFAGTYPQIAKGTGLSPLQLAWYRPEEFFKQLFADVEEMMQGKEIWGIRQRVVGPRGEMGGAGLELQNRMSQLFELQQELYHWELEQAAGKDVSVELALVKKKIEAIDIASFEITSIKYLIKEFGALSRDFPNFKELAGEWQKTIQEQNLSSLINYFRPLVEKNFGFNWGQSEFSKKYLAGQWLGGMTPDKVFSALYMPSVQTISNVLKNIPWERVGGEPNQVLEDRYAVERIMKWAAQVKLPLTNIPFQGGMWQLNKDVIGYLERIMTMYEQMVKQAPELQGLSYEQLREKALKSIEYLMTPALDLFISYTTTGWEDWMSKYADINTLTRGVVEGQVKKYELFDVYKLMYENLDKVQGVDFFRKIFEEGLKIRGGLEDEEAIKKQTDVLKYASYFLMEKYGLTWQELVEGIDKDLLTGLFPELGQIVLNPEYEAGGVGGRISGAGGGVIINLNFNIDNINDVNINDFVMLVMEELMKQLQTYIYV